MPEKWSELILPFERLILVPGEHSVWTKLAFVQVAPMATEEIRLQTPPRQDVIIRNIAVDPANLLTMQFGTANLIVDRSTHIPDEIMFRPANTAGVIQIENVNMAYIKGGATFGWRFQNPSPFFAISYWVTAQIFTRRQAN